MTEVTRGSVLVCDDTDAKRYVLASWLRRDGYLVLEATTGQEALDLVADRHIDLAVLDVHLPDMSGFDVCAAMRADPRTASTPIMHVSAVAVEPADRSAGLDRGADAYLIDPIAPQEMLSTVRSLLRSSAARRDAERLVVRLDRLSAAGLRINVALTPLRVAAAAAEGIARILECDAVVTLDRSGGGDGGGDTGGISVRSSLDGSTRSLALLPGAAEALIRQVREVPLEAGTLLVQSTAPGWSELLSGGYDGPWSVSPVHGQDAVVGLLAVPAHAEVVDEDQMLVRRITEAASVALAKLQMLTEEHRTALTLQRSLLPSGLPHLPGLAVAARYKASGDQVEIGGDFYDAFVTDDGLGVVVIGDVQGHSLEAALVMAELRYSLRAYLHERHTAVEALGLLNDILLRGHPDLMATVCVLVLPPDRSTVEVTNAGHIPVLVVHDGEASYVAETGRLLGVDVHTTTAVRLDVSPGDRMVLMTDGLIERRGRGLTEALDRVAEQVAGNELSGEDLCDELMARWGHGEDDICLIVLDVLAGAV